MSPEPGRPARRMVARAVWILFASLLVVGLAPAAAHACTCVPRQPAAVVKDASAIVVGTPVSRTVDGTAVRYQVRVRESYKARVPQTITVLTSSNSAACGLDLAIGTERMLVLGGAPDGLAAANGEWGATSCDNTSLTTADVATYAGAAITPFTDNAQRSPTPTIIGAFVVLAALIAIPGGIVWWRLKRRAQHPQFDD